MATILVSRGDIIRPDYEADRRRAQTRINELRAEACQHDVKGDVMFANEARRHARRVEIMWDLMPTAPGDDPMGVVADAVGDQTAAWAEEDDNRESRLVEMAKDIGRRDDFRRHE